MNNKALATAMVVLGLFPSLLFAQLYRMEVDAQESGSQKVIDRVFTGNTVGLQVSFYDGGDPLPVTNWTMRFMYGYGQYDTNGMVPVVGTAGASNNVVVFDSATNVFFSENGSYYFSIVGTNTSGKVRTFARGRMIEEYDPASGGSYSNGIPMPWANLNFASKEWIVEYISTNEFETVVSYGTNSTTAFRGDMGQAASNLAASAYAAATNATGSLTNYMFKHAQVVRDWGIPYGDQTWDAFVYGVTNGVERIGYYPVSIRLHEEEISYIDFIAREIYGSMWCFRQGLKVGPYDGGEPVVLWLNGVGITNWTDVAAVAFGATNMDIAGCPAVTSATYNAGTRLFTLKGPALSGGGSGWTNLAFSGTGNAITNATAAGATLTLERGTIGGGTVTNSGASTIFNSRLLTANGAVSTNGTDYAIGCDSSTTNINLTLPDLGTNFSSVIIRKFSNTNTVSILRGTNIAWTLYEDGSSVSLDWWPQKTNWYWRAAL